MGFTSFKFLLFLLIVCVVYFLLPKARAQNVFLLVASYVFYMFAVPAHGAVVLFATAFSYLIGRAVSAADAKKKKKLWLALGVVISLLLLIGFKYFNVFVELFARFGMVADAESILVKYTVPLGISYFTFQIVSYIVDVYRGEIKAQRDFINYALYVSFFPSILSGPINRAGEILPQLGQRRAWNYGATVEGLQRFLTGIFKKLVVADTLGIFVNEIFGERIADYTGLLYIFALLAFTVQLYCDFSGYCDMAIGVAKILGIEMRENFRAPLWARSQSEFWTRWHMSLMSWFRDYIYIPLGGNRKGYARQLLNIFLISLISGLWHVQTLSWNFLMWGVWMGVFRIIEELITRARGLKKPQYKTKAGRALATLCNLAVLIGGWLFFRLSGGQALHVLKNIFRFAPMDQTIGQFLNIAANEISNTGTYFLLLFGGLGIGLLISFIFDVKINRSYLKGETQLNPLGTLKKRRRWLTYWVMGLLVAYFYLMFSTSGSVGAFLYQGF